MSKYNKYIVTSSELGWQYVVNTLPEAKLKRQELKDNGVRQTYIKRKKGPSCITDY